MDFNKIKFSKYLSYLLRHNPSGLNMTKDGYVMVDELIKLSNSNGRVITKELLKEVVRLDDKQRFSFSKDYSMIRANQGHSVDVDLDLKEAIPDVYLFHGTSPNSLESILVNGINRMKRNHVHLSKDLCTAINVGSRYCQDDEVPSVLLVDVFRMCKDGYKFYLSDNGVWLTDHVPSDYVKVLDVSTVNRYKDVANVSDGVKNAFLEELFVLYHKYGVSIGHEDSQGGFILNNICEDNLKWMSQIETCREELSYIVEENER